MSIIFITEKPAVAREYKSVLGINDTGGHEGYYEGASSVLAELLHANGSVNVIITWAIGHLIHLCDPEKQNTEWEKWNSASLPMLPANYKYEPVKKTYSQFQTVKSLYLRNDIDCIYYAGDSGREGIYIQALIRNQIFKSAPKFQERVVWISSFTEEAIKEGIKTAKPYSEYQSMIDSGYARAISDWLIGMNFTRGLTIKNGPLIRIGRVKTPTLAMIVKRQEEIDNFVKTDYYGIKAAANPNDKINWKATKLSKYFESNLLYNENGFRKKEDAESLLNELTQDTKLIVDNVNVKTTSEYAPLLFNLADLQATCSKVLKITPAKTLDIAQKLYEVAKLTTYPRTDSRYLDTKTQKQYAAMGYNVPNRYVNDKKVTDHFAIIPTFHGNKTGLNETELKVYELILSRFMNTMKPPYVYDAVSIVYKHRNGEPFYEGFRIVKDMGWKEKDDSEDISTKAVPNKGDVVSVTFSIKNMETKPPAAYTTGTIIIAMEKAGKLIEDEELRENIKTSGIGTSATRAKIIEDLETPNKDGAACITIEKKTQKIAPTDFGKQVIGIVKKFDEDLTSPIKTAEMEDKLNAINDKEISYQSYMEIIQNYVRDTITKILNTETQKMSFGGISGECPHCKGEIAKGQYGIYCKNKCGMIFDKVYGHKLTDAQVAKLLEGKSVSYTDKGNKTTVLPNIVENPWNGKVYYNWESKRESGGNFKGSSSSASSSKSNSKSKNTGNGSNAADIWASFKK